MAKVAPSVTTLPTGQSLLQGSPVPGASGSRQGAVADRRVTARTTAMLVGSGVLRDPSLRGLSVSALPVGSDAAPAGHPDAAGSGTEPGSARHELARLLNIAGLELPDELLQAHADAMRILLARDGDNPRLETAVADAAQQLERLHSAFLSALPSSPAAGQETCQHIAFILVGDARLINHIHHAGEVPAEPEAFMRRLVDLPPSRLDRAGAPGQPAGGPVR